MTTPLDDANASISTNIVTNGTGRITASVLAATLTAVMAAVTYVYINAAPLVGGQVPIANLPIGQTSSTVAIGSDSRFTTLAAGVASIQATQGLSVLAYGADPTYVADSTTAFQNWWTACMASYTGAYGGAGGHSCVIPPGHYRLSQSLYWDFANNIAGGGDIIGAGQNASLLDFSATSGTNLHIGSSAGNAAIFTGSISGNTLTVGSISSGALVVGQYVQGGSMTSAFVAAFAGGSGGTGTYTLSGSAQTVASSAMHSYTNSGIFYARFGNFGVVANTSQSALQLGNYGNTAGDYTDAINGFRFDSIFAKNIAGTSGTAGMAVNEVYSSTFTNITTSAGCASGTGACPAGGDSLQIWQAAFNNFSGSFSGARVGVHFAGIGSTSGYSFGNVILSPDLEVNYYDLAIDTPDARDNTIIGGQWSWDYADNATAITASAGAGNVVQSPNFSEGTDKAMAGGVGVTIKGGAQFGIATPTFTSGNIILNTTGRDILVTAYNLAAGGYLCYNVGATQCPSNNVAGGSLTAVVRVGDSVKLVSVGQGNWAWMELP